MLRSKRYVRAAALALAAMGVARASEASTPVQYNTVALSRTFTRPLDTIDILFGPNLGANSHFISLLGNPVLNAAGEVAFAGDFAGSGVDSTNNRGIFANATGAVAAVARTGSAGAGPNLGAGVTFTNFSNPLLDPAGEVVFRGDL